MPYQYSTLSNSRIRLLVLLPGQFDDPLYGEIIEMELSSDLDTMYSYEALSYVWGDQANLRPIHIISQQGNRSSTMNLGPNLYSALRQLRLGQSSRIIWCDFICINQANLKERAQEVTRMAEIYRKAQRVVVWLGLEADESALAIQTIEYAGSQVRIEPELRAWNHVPNSDPKFKREGLNPPFTAKELQAIQKLVARSWFKRLWVRQEVTLAKSSIVVVGDREVSWTHLISAVAFLDGFIRLRAHTDIGFGRDLFNLFEFGCLGAYKDIMDILHACRACECTEDRDRVYAILGLLSSYQALSIQPDYSKGIKHVYQDLVMQYYFQHQKLNILTLCEDAETPSWVPDLHKLRLGTGINTRVVQYCWASGEAAASLVLLDNNTIEIYGVKCGVLGKSVSSRIDTDNCCKSKALKRAVVKILRDAIGEDVQQWDEARLEILTKGFLGCLWSERTGRKNHSSLSFALSELKKWTLEEPNSITDEKPDEHESLVLINHIDRVFFHGDACRWTQDGYIGLGFNACEEGDLLYAILGCRRLIALRKEPRGRYRIIGKFDHPGYNDGEAFLGELAVDWKVNYQHLFLASNRPRFVHEDGSWQWQDPRLQCIAPPDGWHEGQDQDGYPYWFRTNMSHERSYADPRLTYHELKQRGVDVERLVIS